MDWDLPDFSFENTMNFGGTDGETFIEQRANNGGFFDLGFDQEKISKSIFDVLGSGIQAAAQGTRDAISGNAKNAGKSILDGFVQRFTATKTGQDIQASAVTAQITRWLQNPAILFAAAFGMVFLLFALRK
jgi:hypothetical protein